MYNEAQLAPFWLRHYAPLADRIFVWDDHSTDGTAELLSREPKVTLLPMDPGQHGDNDPYWVKDLFPQYEQHSRGEADWVIVADADEFILHPDLLGVLRQQLALGIQMLKCEGYIMVADRFPADRGQQIYDEIQLGLPDRMMSKWTIHSADISVRFRKGRHGPSGHRHFKHNPEAGIRLLHYRYFGDDYYAARTNRNVERNDMVFHHGLKYDPQAPQTLPDGTIGSAPEWFRDHRHEAVNVVAADSFQRGKG